MLKSLFWLLVAVDVALGAFCVWRVRAEYPRDAKLSFSTAVAVWSAYLLHLGLLGYAAWSSLWLVPVNRPAAVIAGVVLVVPGIVILSAAVYSFRSVRRMSGLEEDKLVTGGIYRFSRNPQNVGLALVLLGIAVVGRSGVAMVLAGVFWRMFWLYLPVEEEHLHRVFGRAYERYREVTPRFIGFPRAATSNRGPNDGTHDQKSGN